MLVFPTLTRSNPMTQPTLELPLTYAGFTVPSSFAASQRPIYLYPTGYMSKKQTMTEAPKVRDAMKVLLESRTPGRVLIHTVSYELNGYLYDELRSLRASFTYTESKGKDRALAAYRANDSAVLFAPSLERGLDLPQDFCRHIIIPKVPFPNLGDKQISARLHSRGGQLWYSVLTIRSLVQMTGRGMRDASDQCNSYILDSQFISNIWRKSQHLIPQWWSDALIWNAGRLI
jgi:ATP-dependent DNA helicase DinG